MMNVPRQFQLSYENGVTNLVFGEMSYGDGGERIALDVNCDRAVMSLESAITSRASERAFSGHPLPLSKLAKLLYLGNGVRSVCGHEEVRYRRNVPSAGNMGSIETYCLALSVAGIDPGIYHFDSFNHQLIVLHKGDYRTWLKQSVFLQAEASEAAVVVVLACSLAKIAKKYKQRALQLALMDAGHVSQNIFLAATAFDLAAFPTAGFVNGELDAALKLDGLDSRSVLALCVGARSSDTPLSM